MTTGPTPQPVRPARDRPEVKILVVDDEDDVRESTAMLVRSLGFTPATCGNARDILETVARERPDLVLQDLRMPGLNVSGLVAALRTAPETADIPLVFFSANSDLPTTAARYDVWGYLAKPFVASELTALVEQVLASRVPHPDVPAREVQREVKQTFHDYWNLLAAMGNYVTILNQRARLPADLQPALAGLDEILLKLEAKTDRLRSYILSLSVPLGEGDDQRPAGGQRTSGTQRQAPRSRLPGAGAA